MITAQQVETWQAEVRDLRAEIGRLRAQNTVAAAFLDELAATNERHGYSTEAADCRKMAKKLRK